MKAKRIVGFVRTIPDDAKDTRKVQFVISTARKDRHNTILDLAGWDLKDYHNNPIVGYQHDVYGDGFFTKPDPDSVIGKSRVFVEGEELIGEVEFESAAMNPLAEKVFQKVLFGSLRAASVGFMPTEKGKWGEGEESRDGKTPTYYFGKRQLLEWSIVNIPSNADAMARELEEEFAEIAAERDEVSEAEKLALEKKRVLDKIKIGLTLIHLNSL